MTANKASKRSETKFCRTPIRSSDYKKRLTKKQVHEKKRHRIFEKYKNETANCGEDKVLQSYQMHFKNHNEFIKKLNYSKWHGIKYDASERNITINKTLLVAHYNGLDDWKKTYFKYQYYSNGVTFGFTNKNRPLRAVSNKWPNMVTKMGYKALAYGLKKADDFIQQLIADIPASISSSSCKRIDAYIDVPIPFGEFYKRYHSGLIAGKIGDNPYFYGRLAGPNGLLVKESNQTIHINAGGSIEIVIYDKAAELKTNEEKLNAYILKHCMAQQKLPDVLTRIEIRAHRKFLRLKGYNGQSIDTVDNWFDCRAALVEYVMTKLFRFIEKDGNTMPEWDWALSQYREWSAKEASRDTAALTLQQIPPKSPMTIDKRLKRAFAEILNLLILHRNRPIYNRAQLFSALREVIKDTSSFGRSFWEEFFRRGNSALFKRQCMNDMSGITRIPTVSDGYPPESRNWGIVQFILWDMDHDHRTA